MTNEQIEAKLVALIKDERRVLNEILALINQAEDRDIPLLRGFPSTYEWLTRGLGYSNAAAYRRLEAARLLKIVPAAAEKLATGELNLTNVAKARGAIKAQEKISKKKMNAGTQAEILSALENKTSAEADRTLLDLLPDTAKSTHQERTTRIDAEHSRLTLNLSDDDLENLAWAKDFLSHAAPNASNGELISRVLKEFRRRHSTSAAEDKKAKAGRSACEYRDAKTGRVCGATHQIEGDHIVPRALGGGDEASNKRRLCKRHNLLVAKEVLGRAWAECYRRRAGARAH